MESGDMLRCMLICGFLLAGPCAWADLTREQASIPKRLADRIIADSDAYGVDAQRKIAESTDSDLADVSDVIDHASQWRYYSRDRGVMVAIPVKQRLNYADRVEAEKKIASIYERLVNQREDQPIEGAIRVVFIEPASPCACPRGSQNAGGAFRGGPGAGAVCYCR
jgi:hypothetical protein